MLQCNISTLTTCACWPMILSFSVSDTCITIDSVMYLLHELTTVKNLDYIIQYICILAWQIFVPHFTFINLTMKNTYMSSCPNIITVTCDVTNNYHIFYSLAPSLQNLPKRKIFFDRFIIIYGYKNVLWTYISFFNRLY